MENAWMMFNHVKHVQGWTTMAYHAYDLVYCKVMTIAVCDMQSKVMEAQCILWRKLNAIVQNKGLGTPISKGFMMNGAQANWNAVQIVYGTEDLTLKMVDKKRTCFFHWI
jgi:hypothetical protein